MAHLTHRQITLIAVIAAIAILVAGLIIEEQIRKKQKAAGLIAELKAGEKDKREEAARALGEMGDKAAVEPLLECLRCDDPSPASQQASLQVAVIVALGKIRDKRAIGPLTGYLKSEKYDVRKSTAEALVSLLWKPESEEQKITFLIAREDWDGLVKMRERAVEPILDMLRDREPIVRAGAAGALGDIGDRKAVEPLIDSLKDEAPSVRWGAALSLGKLKDKRAIDPLIQRLNDEDRIVRRIAAEALGNMGAASATGPLKEALEKETYRHVQFAIKDALRKLKTEPDKPPESR